MIIGTVSLIMVGLTVVTFFFEQHSELTATERNHPIEEQETQESVPPQQNPVQPIYIDDTIGYSLQNDQLQVTFNKGSDWVLVPVEKEKLYSGEYSGNKQELIENSFILTQNWAAFLYSEGNSLKLKYSINQGETWEDSVVTDQYPPIRFRKVEFLNDSFGYVIVSGDRTMSQEWTTVYITNDGGKQWKETSHSGVTRLIYDGGFVNENTGFLSFGILNPVEPNLYVTQDGGRSWSNASVSIPEKYHEIFVMAEVPFKEENHLAAFINQGPNGDYQGGKLKGKFTSNDNGNTWEFFKVVE
jgi:hypothetical protein